MSLVLFFFAGWAVLGLVCCLCAFRALLRTWEQNRMRKYKNCARAGVQLVAASLANFQVWPSDHGSSKRFSAWPGPLWQCAWPFSAGFVVVKHPPTRPEPSVARAALGGYDYNGREHFRCYSYTVSHFGASPRATCFSRTKPGINAIPRHYYSH